MQEKKKSAAACLNLSTAGTFGLLAFVVLLQTATIASSAQTGPSHRAASDAEAPGTILIDVSESGRYSQFELRLEIGTVSTIKEQRVPSGSSVERPTTFQPPTGAIQGCNGEPHATSPNGDYTAHCTVLRKADHSPLHDQFILTNTNSNTDSYPWNPIGWRGIDGFAWAPNSRSIAVLSHSEHFSKSPTGIFLGLSGHPIPFGTVYVDVIDLQTSEVRSYVVRKNAKYVSARILRWSE